MSLEVATEVSCTMSDDLEAIAARAPTVVRVRAFVDWVGGGRALTQTGRLRRTDALALVGLLDTGDVLDQRFPIQALGALLVQPGDRLRYEYDFGDSREHEIVLEAGEQAGHSPACTDGAGRCPPEDVGGIRGYEDLRRVLAAPGEDGHTGMLEWLGIERACDFDPLDFSVERANTAIASVLIARSA